MYKCVLTYIYNFTCVFATLFLWLLKTLYKVFDGIPMFVIVCAVLKDID